MKKCPYNPMGKWDDGKILRRIFSLKLRRIVSRLLLYVVSSISNCLSPSDIKITLKFSSIFLRHLYMLVSERLKTESFWYDWSYNLANSPSRRARARPYTLVVILSVISKWLSHETIRYEHIQMSQRREASMMNLLSHFISHIKTTQLWDNQI